MFSSRKDSATISEKSTSFCDLLGPFKRMKTSEIVASTASKVIAVVVALFLGCAFIFGLTSLATVVFFFIVIILAGVLFACARIYSSKECDRRFFNFSSSKIDESVSEIKSGYESSRLSFDSRFKKMFRGRGEKGEDTGRKSLEESFRKRVSSGGEDKTRTSKPLYEEKRDEKSKVDRRKIPGVRFPDPSIEKAMEKALSSPEALGKASPGFFDEVIHSMEILPGFKEFIIREKLSVEEVFELFLSIHSLVTKRDGFWEGCLSPNLYNKARSFGIESLREEAKLTFSQGVSFFQIKALYESSCPFYFLSEFLKIGLTEEALIGLKEPHKLGGHVSLSTIAAYSVSRLGLSEKKDTIFSRKFWALSLCMKPLELIYTEMCRNYYLKDKARCSLCAKSILDAFCEYFSRAGRAERFGVSFDEISEEDLMLLCEHGISFRGICWLSVLKVEQVDMLSHLSNHEGRNILADWMLSFGERLFFVFGRNTLHRSSLLMDLFSSQVVSGSNTVEIEAIPRAKSIRGITWKELEVLAWKWETERVAEFLSQLEGDKICIRRCDLQEWYTPIRVYGDNDLSFRFSINPRTSRQQARGLSWTNWNRSVYRRGRLRIEES
ncbi:DUF1389 domain-containing protein [Chlamydiifrater phoenicopteri]|uniref:DUF1389 domain-containing protein n=1 Tax=Chlamydiifrater phoenicopteri TaxID=2681469 RepID=UPI001BD0ADE1|nr:DUF1389 domain-containing protein [Chlamydiifrater phoenicopteri]